MRRRGFTLIELLVVIAIIAVLIGILLPVLFRARGAAMKVVCSARLRDLTMAATLYQQTARTYPAPMQRITVAASGPATVRPAPQHISIELLNQLRPYLNFREIGPNTPVSALPAFMQCPFVESETHGRGPFADAAGVTWTYFTGYAYLGRLSEVSVVQASAPGPTGILPLPPIIPVLIPLPKLPLIGGLVPVLEPGVELKPGRAATAKPSRRAVLWADNVSETNDPLEPWQFGHSRHAARGGTSLGHADPSQLSGQHRAYTDGSVEWVAGGTTDLQTPPRPTSQNTSAASFKTFLGELWWF